jgi:hypothetical protein
LHEDCTTVGYQAQGSVSYHNIVIIYILPACRCLYRLVPLKQITRTLIAL